MAALSGEDIPRGDGRGTSRLDGVPLGQPLAGHDGGVWWGAWAEVGGRPVLATGGIGGMVRLWDGQDRALVSPVIWDDDVGTRLRH